MNRDGTMGQSFIIVIIIATYGYHRSSSVIVHHQRLWLPSLLQPPSLLQLLISHKKPPQPDYLPHILGVKIWGLCRRLSKPFGGSLVIVACIGFAARVWPREGPLRLRAQQEQGGGGECHGELWLLWYPPTDVHRIHGPHYCVVGQLRVQASAALPSIALALPTPHTIRGRARPTWMLQV